MLCRMFATVLVCTPMGQSEPVEVDGRIKAAHRGTVGEAKTAYPSTPAREVR